MGQQQDKAASGWKLAAGALALLVSFQLGYSAGSQDVVGAEVPESIVPATAAAALDRDSGATSSSAMVLSAPGAAVAELEPATALEAPDTELALDRDLETAAPTLASAPASAAIAGATEQAAPAAVAAAAATPVAVPPPAAPSTDIGSASKPARSSVPGYAAPVARYGCAENRSCYGDISTATGRPRTTYVRGYHRRDGTYVRSHYRSRR